MTSLPIPRFTVPPILCGCSYLISIADVRNGDPRVQKWMWFGSGSDLLAPDPVKGSWDPWAEDGHITL